MVVKSKKSPISAIQVESRLNAKLVGYVVLTAVVILIAVPLVYFYRQYQHTQLLLNNPAKAADEEIKQVVAEVGKLMILPKDETPTVATVTDKSKLQSQVFFANVENGDKVMIYTKNKKAIIYRPSLNKIVEVGPVNIAQTQPSTTPPPQQPTPTVPDSSPSGQITPVDNLKVNAAIYNGTKTKGLASITEDIIQQKYPSVKVTTTGNTKNDYSKTLVIDLTGQNTALVSQLAGFLSGDVSKMPSGETKPDTDILVILGK